ncbi:D-glycero-beta-D-manno-heptose-7-phosphate kinase [Pedobacter metabolipauper]|uniref:D-beta-D-heptose 7-phosphate kinase/D-beta-D-heptose 1-phosphate adenosyltransferase n=1 Tax=Pedobacter metabolipauper TaxID=425513 RepID=A0A4V3D0Z1_9SPHI|nr:D-glycero-beta-D-manno-heptose-7-phosphate kinase [Pedobacter metabolipauper]TDQ08344.1 D-beta-D-heptose 7-phosphate kinase/D-beta-D-heptose 1-phosphate adenosyltransferase [Pedobacter metabolipauper]
MLADKLYHSHHNDPAPNVLVIGDLMLDHYVFGSATRLSPEAPVPIVNVSKESKIIGGAANVASNLIALGATVYLAGIIGDDTFGEEIKTLLDAKNINTSLIIRDQSRVTTVKTRIIAGNHQIVRMDREDIHDISGELEESFFNLLSAPVENADIVILSDYNKGLLTHNLSLKIIALCNSLHKKIIVDPKGLDYTKYHGAFLIKPNRKELAEASKTERINSEESLVKAAHVILNATDADHLIVTLSEAGIAMITKTDCRVIPVVATEVYDVTGAGDTVIATLAYCLSHGFSVEEAAIVSNYAASIVIKHIGSATTTVPEIITALKNN